MKNQQILFLFISSLSDGKTDFYLQTVVLLCFICSSRFVCINFLYKQSCLRCDRIPISAQLNRYKVNEGVVWYYFTCFPRTRILRRQGHKRQYIFWLVKWSVDRILFRHGFEMKLRESKWKQQTKRRRMNERKQNDGGHKL